MTSQEQPEVKCVVWDLDNTLWEGTLMEGDDVRVKPGIPHILQTLDERGILHSIASKNMPDPAQRKLREFGIWDYFLYPEINWNAKSSSIASIRNSLNLGMDAFLLVDDQAYERDEVRSVHPQVACLDAREYLNLPGLPRLNPRFVTPECRNRRHMYRQDQARRAGESEFRGPRREFLESLQIHLTISPADKGDLERAAELTVRTHQLNATGVIYSREELERFLCDENHRLLICDMTDKYGSLGKIGLSLIEITPKAHHIKLLLMSCRVMSLGLGSVLLTHIQREARRQGKAVLADFKHNQTNRQMFMAFKFARFTEVCTANEMVLLRNNPAALPELPGYVRLTTVWDPEDR